MTICGGRKTFSHEDMCSKMWGVNSKGTSHQDHSRMSPTNYSMKKKELNNKCAILIYYNIINKYLYKRYSFKEQVLQTESDASIMPWFARVPSKSNIADDPSRGQVEQLTKLNCVQEHVSLKRKLELIDHKTSGGAEGSIVPNQSSKKVRKLSPSGLNKT